ncbi:MAG: DUF4034 domain-containing protein [Gammaproteobacteria bacterium]|nr:DUF4034 domain-containing protein [Gammaproteobacteria bacterium]
MKTSRIFFLILFCLVFQHSQASTYKSTDANSLAYQNNSSSPLNNIASGAFKLHFRQLLKEHKFIKLNQLLHSLQTDSESNILTEGRLFVAYESFEIKNISSESDFISWVNTTPNAYQAYLARASYYYRMGWQSRGHKWANETKKEQFNKMSDYFKKSMSDISRALKLNKRSMVPYYLLIGISKISGADSEPMQVMKKALKINPLSFAIREQYLHFITPRWGGSYEAMESFVNKSLTYASKNQKLKLLQGSLYTEAGYSQALINQYSFSNELYTKALEFGDNHKILYERGKNNYRTDEYDDAIKDLSSAIKLYAENARYYYWRSNAFAGLKQYTKASADIQQAYKLDPDDKYIIKSHKRMVSILERQGYDLNQNNKPSAAIEKYNEALLLDSKKSDLYSRRARAYINLNKLDLAYNDMTTAIKINPKNINYYLLIDYLLAKKKNWNKIISYWNQFIKLSPEHSRAYMERGGAYFHKGDLKAAIKNAKIAADMGNIEGKEMYEKYKHLM